MDIRPSPSIAPILLTVSTGFSSRPTIWRFQKMRERKFWGASIVGWWQSSTWNFMKVFWS